MGKWKRAYSELCQTSVIEYFGEIVNNLKLLFSKNDPPQVFDRVLNTHLEH